MAQRGEAPFQASILNLSDCRNYQNIKKLGEEKKEKKSWGVGGRERDPSVVGNKSQTLGATRTLPPSQSPQPLFKAPMSMQSPPKAPTISTATTSLFCFSPSAEPPAPLQPDPFAHYPLHQACGVCRGSLSLSPTLSGHRGLSSPGATFTLALGAVLPLNQDTAIKHMPPSSSSTLALQTTEKNFTIIPQRAGTRNLAATAAL